MFITEEDIRNEFSPEVFRKGKSYFQQGRVLSLQKADTKGDAWRGRVVGSDLYHVEIEFVDDMLFLHCDCPAYEKYGKCKHEVAVLLKLANKKSDHDLVAKAEEPNTEANRLIRAFSSFGLPAPRHQTDRTLLNVEYTLKLHEHGWEEFMLALTMKVGEGRPYVVKDVKDFIRNIENGEEHEFTKNFRIHSADHTFREADRDIFLVISEIIQTDAFYNADYYYSSRSASPKEIIIPPAFIKRLFPLLVKNDCAFAGGRYAPEPLQWVENEPPFSFSLDKKDRGYALNLDFFKDSLYLDKYGLLLSGGCFYNLSREQQAIVEEMKEKLPHAGSEMSISSREIHSFVSHAIPALKKVGTLDLSESVSDEIIDVPLTARLYLDYQDGMLKAKLEFQYGNSVINPFGDQKPELPENSILMRDAAKERNLVHLLEDGEFMFHRKELYLDGDDSMYRFLFEILPRFQEEAEVYLTDAAENLIQTEKRLPKMEIALEEDNGLLSVSFRSDNFTEEDIRQLLQAAVEKRRYHRLSDGVFIDLESDTIQNMAEFFGEFDLTLEDMEDGAVQLPAYRSLQVDEAAGGRAQAKYNKQLRQLIDSIKNPVQNEYPVPQALNAELRDYQHTGFQWLKALGNYHFGGILADDMGLGKTIQSIAFLLSELEEGNTADRPALIVAPASLVYNWKNEFSAFAPDLKVQVAAGTKAERESLLENAGDADVIITSYPLVRRDSQIYKKQPFSCMILDEAQAIKNSATKTAKTIKAIPAAKRFALSGTPIENSLDELWSLFDAIMPGFFPAKREFKKMSHDRIARMSRPFILRRMKQDVLSELPDKIESIHTSELTAEQKKLYLGYLDRIKGETMDAIEQEGFQKSRMKILAGLTRLRQICCHPALFLENYEGESGKMIELQELVDTSLANNQRILVFSQFSSMLQMIKADMESRGISVFYIDGNTKSQERVEMAERFNNGENDVFLISLKAGGTGLNLTGADTVILYDLWWNPAVEEQAAGRAHRMGQKKVVQVFRLIAEGTIEEKIHELQQKKKELIGTIIQPGEKMISSLSEEDIRELLSI